MIKELIRSNHKTHSAISTDDRYVILGTSTANDWLREIYPKSHRLRIVLGKHLDGYLGCYGGFRIVLFRAPKNRRERRRLF